MVLLEGHTGGDAAGQVIEAFGAFVIGGNYVVGFIVFSILMIINFIVITKVQGDHPGRRALLWTLCRDAKWPSMPISMLALSTKRGKGTPGTGFQNPTTAPWMVRQNLCAVTPLLAS